MRGRKPKPKKVHKLNGNPSKKKKKTKEKKKKKTPEKDKKKTSEKINENLPKPPTYLCTIGKNEWNRIIIELDKTGSIDKLDMALLESYCQTYANMRKAAKIMNEKKPGKLTYSTPNKAKQQIPEVGMYNKSASLLKGLCSELGLSPVSRTRIEPPEFEDADDGMEDILDGDTKSKMPKGLKVIKGGKYNAS